MDPPPYAPPGTPPFSPPLSGEGIVNRLHKLTPFADLLRLIPLIGFIFIGSSYAIYSGGVQGGEHHLVVAIPEVIEVLILAAVSIIAGFIRVAVTRFGIENNELRIDSGLIRTQSKRVRLDRVQAIDILRPFAARIMGLSALRVSTGGTDRSAVWLRFLSAKDAESYRSDWLNRAHHRPEVSSGTPERENQSAQEKVLTTVPHGVLIASCLLNLISANGAAFVVIGALPITIISLTSPNHSLFLGSVFGIVALGIFYTLVFLWREVSRLWNFSIAESDDGIHIRQGLLNTSAQTIPKGRIQAVSVRQPLLWRIFGWASLHVNVAGYAGEHIHHSTNLLPVVQYDYALWMAGRVLGGIDVARIPMTRPPPRARWAAPLRWHYMGTGSDPFVLVARHGVFHRNLEVVPHQRTQSVRMTAGPWERFLHLANVHLDSTRGPVRITIGHRDENEARVLVNTQADRARQARDTHG